MAKRQPKKFMAIGLGAVVVEAALILGAFMLIKGPPEAHSFPMSVAFDSESPDRIVEVLVLGSRLSNAGAGVSFVYETEIYVQVRRRNLGHVKGELDQFQNELKSEIATIWRTSDPQHFQEPRLDTLTRKVDDFLRRRFGFDQRSGEAIVEKTVVVLGTGYRVD